MIGKPSSKINNRVGVSMENHKIHKLKHEPHLSGAYIRTLVKHLTSLKTINGDHKLPESVNSNGDCLTAHEPPPPPPPPQKKQVRRRRNTTKPYQERLLNMAEARREIVTALKFHRASMKQREVVTATPATTDLSSNYPSVPYYRPISSPPPPPPLNHENLDFTLPNQTLGLNLNFQDFINLDANLYHNPLSNYANYATSSLSSSSSSASSQSTTSSVTISELVTEEVRATRMPEEVVATSTVAAATTSSSSSSGGMIMNGGLHHAMDDEGMEEIRSLGEQHQMEWNDTVNLLTSARWFKFLTTIEIEQGEGKFDQVVEFPPCMDIDEIEGMDGEWLA